MQDYEDILPHYYGYIKSIVNRFKVSSYDFDDLFQAGIIGFYKAYLNYNKDLNIKLTTYAFKYVYGEIYKEYKRLNLYGDITFNKIRKYINENQNKTTDEIIKELNISKELLFRALSNIDKYTLVDYDLLDCPIEKKDYMDYLDKEELLLYNYYFVHRLSQYQISRLLHTSQASISRRIKRMYNTIYNCKQ